MSKITCFNCSRTVLDDVRFCPHCGANIGQGLTEDDYERNPYLILQVSPSAEDEVINAVFRSLAKKYHPDVYRGEDASRKMSDLNWAYDILSNPKKRRKWDARHSRKEDASRGTPPPKAKPTSQGQRSASPPPHASPTDDRQPSVREPSKSALDFRAFGKAVVVTLAILIIILLILGSNDARNSSTSNAAGQRSGLSPTTFVTRIPRPSPVPTKRPISDQGGWDNYWATQNAAATRNASAGTDPNCILWSRARATAPGNVSCVYGKIVQIQTTEEYAQIIRFNMSATSLMLRSEDFFFEDVSTGLCVAAVGPVRSAFDQNSNRYYFMLIEEIDLFIYGGC